LDFIPLDRFKRFAKMPRQIKGGMLFVNSFVFSCRQTRLKNLSRRVKPTINYEEFTMKQVFRKLRPFLVITTIGVIAAVFSFNGYLIIALTLNFSSLFYAAWEMANE
jgi:hypothetical protein